MPHIVVLALNTLAYAVYSFALYLLVLSMIAIAGPELVTEAIQETGMRTQAGMRWVRLHPIAFTLDFVASAALAGLLLQLWISSSQPLWVSLPFTFGIFGASLVWWPLMIGWIAQHPRTTVVFLLAVLCSAMTLYLFTVVEWIRQSLAYLLVIAGFVVIFPVLVGMMTIVGPIIWGLLLAIGYVFRILVVWLGLHGIAKLLESIALVALGLAEYFHFYEIDKDYAQLAYFGAFCGAVSVGFTVLSLLPAKVKAWLGDTKLSGNHG